MINRLLCLVAGLVLAAPAFGADSYWSAGLSGGVYAKGPSADYVCHKQYDDYVAGSPSTPTSYLGAFGVTGTSATCKGLYSNSGTSFVTGSASYVTCPASFPYFNGTSCVATLPPPPPPPSCSSTSGVAKRDITIGWATGPSVGSAATYLYDPVKKPFVSPQNSFCIDSCFQNPIGVPQEAWQDQVPSANGYYRIYAKGTPMEQQGGGSCTVGTGAGMAPDVVNAGTAPAVQNTFNGKCPTGSTPTGVSSDGMTICSGTTTQPASTTQTTTTTPKTTTTDANGNTVDTTSTTQTNSDGSKTTVTTTTTTAPDGTKSISMSSNTTAATSGAPGTTDAKADDPPPSDMCKLHPELNVCHNSQVQGACALITCDGDAIQCATLRAAAQIQCQQKSDLDELKANASVATGQSILSGADPQAAAIAANTAGTSVDLSNPNLDSTGFLGGGACLAPKTFNVSGRSVVVSFDSLCGSIQPLRAVIMAVASIIAYLLVSRAVLQS